MSMDGSPTREKGFLGSFTRLKSFSLILMKSGYRKRISKIWDCEKAKVN